MYRTTQYFYILKPPIKQPTTRGTQNGNSHGSRRRIIHESSTQKIILQSGHEIIAEAANGDEAINQYQNSKPDLVLMDIVMPPTPRAKDGIEALKQIILSRSSRKNRDVQLNGTAGINRGSSQVWRKRLCCQTVPASESHGSTL